MYRRKKFAPARRCAGRRRRGNRVLEDLLSITILLCSAALLITVLAPWEEGSAYSAGQDTDVCWPEPLPAEPPLPADRGEPFPAEPVPVDSWQLLLVNRWHSLPEDYSVQLVELRNGFQVDERCYPDLQDMMDDCRAEGLSPVICSAYRTREFPLFEVNSCLSALSPSKSSRLNFQYSVVSYLTLKTLLYRIAPTVNGATKNTININTAVTIDAIMIFFFVFFWICKT